MEPSIGHLIGALSLLLFIHWLPVTVNSAGYLDLPYSTNKSIVCELLNGTCVDRDECAAYTSYLVVHYTPFRFACNKTSVCCYELKVRKSHHLSHHASAAYGHHGVGSHGSHGGGSLLQTLIKHTNRTGLCEAVGGLCVSPGECAIAQHGYSKGKFDCNVTTLCCYRFKRHTTHHDYGAGGFHGNTFNEVDVYDYFDHDDELSTLGLHHLNSRQHARQGHGYRRRQRQRHGHHRRRHQGHVISGHGHGGFGAHLIRPVGDHAYVNGYTYQKPVILLNTNFTELCINAGGTCLEFENCATTGGWHTYSSRKFSCDISNICCFPIPTDRYNFGYLSRRKRRK